MAIRNRKTKGKGSAFERKLEESERQIEALPFVGKAEDKARDWWEFQSEAAFTAVA